MMVSLDNAGLDSASTGMTSNDNNNPKVNVIIVHLDVHIDFNLLIYSIYLS